LVNYCNFDSYENTNAKPKWKCGFILSETEEIPDEAALEREIERMRSEGYNHIIIVDSLKPGEVPEKH